MEFCGIILRTKYKKFHEKIKKLHINKNYSLFKFLEKLESKT